MIPDCNAYQRLESEIQNSRPEEHERLLEDVEEIEAAGDVTESEAHFLRSLLRKSLVALFALMPLNVSADSGMRERLIIRDRVDSIEKNNCYDEEGKLKFTQIIYRRFTSDGHRVMGWRMAKRDSQLPSLNPKTGKYEALWHDEGVMRRVEANSYGESHTQYDPEVLDQEMLPTDERPKFSTPYGLPNSH